MAVPGFDLMLRRLGTGPTGTVIDLRRPPILLVATTGGRSGLYDCRTILEHGHGWCAHRMVLSDRHDELLAGTEVWLEPMLLTPEAEVAGVEIDLERKALHGRIQPLIIVTRQAVTIHEQLPQL
jgi:hypothetical protein